MKKSKKNLKGMTLFEMIISIAVFAIMGGLLILVGMHIDNMSKASNNLKNKVVKESPYAANHITQYTDRDGNTVDLPKSAMNIEVSLGASSVNLQAEKYGTVDVVKDGLSASQIDSIDNGPNNELNLEFIEFVEEPEEEDPLETP